MIGRIIMSLELDPWQDVGAFRKKKVHEARSKPSHSVSRLATAREHVRGVVRLTLWISLLEDCWTLLRS